MAFVRTLDLQQPAAPASAIRPIGLRPPGSIGTCGTVPRPQRPFNPNRFGVYPNAYSYFRYFWDYAGGQITDSGMHMIDIVQMAFGDPMPAASSRSAGKFWFRTTAKLPTRCRSRYQYPGFIGSWEHRSQQHRGGTNPPDGHHLPWHARHAVCRSRSHSCDAGKGLAISQPFEMKRVSDPHPLHWTNFLDCVRTRNNARTATSRPACVRRSRPSSGISRCARKRASIGMPISRRCSSRSAAVPRRQYRDPWELVA